MAEVDHAAARAFARKVVRAGKREDAVNLARAYIELRELLHEAGPLPPRIARALRKPEALMKRLFEANGRSGHIYETPRGRFQALLKTPWDGSRSSTYLGVFDTERECEEAIASGLDGRRVKSKATTAARRAIEAIHDRRDGRG